MDHDFGKHLQKARTDLGLSIEQAAEAVRIRSTFLRSLEASDLTKFPNAAYAKSFLIMYGRYLGVDVKSVAVQIDTTTQMKVEGYQYLTNRAAGQPKTKADPELTFSAAPEPKSNGSWLPLIVLAGTLVLALIAFVVWQNMNRLGDGKQPAPAKTAPQPSPAAAVEPINKTSAPVPAPAAPVEIAEAPQTSPLADDSAAPRPKIISIPEPTETVPGEIPRARPISPVAKIASSDSDALADLSPPRPRLVLPGSVTPTAARSSVPPATSDDEDNALAADPNTTILEPKRKSWVIIRAGPGGQTLFEDYLYPSAKPMRLPKGRYFIELRDAEAVEISRAGQRVGYSSPGVLLE